MCKFPMWVTAEKDDKITEGKLVITELGVILEIPLAWEKFKGKLYIDFRQWLQDHYTVVQIRDLDGEDYGN